jgi:FkbM family methyltransferase
MSELLSILYRYRRGPSRSIGERILKFLARPAIRLVLSRFPDPAVRIEIGRRKLWMNWSHNLPFFLASYPNYETEIGRLAEFIHGYDGRLMMIDVGANVGDTIACLPPLKNAGFLCVEASKRYFELLRRNFGSETNVKLVLALLGDGDRTQSGLALQECGGTAHVGGLAGEVTGVPTTTLDALVAQDDSFYGTNLLKIDTDGYDLRVLRGASRLLERARPCLHVEMSTRHWRDYGNSSAAEAIAYLSQYGYDQMLLYDNQGYVIGGDRLSAPRLLPAIADYAMRKEGFYANIVAFHSQCAYAAEFLKRELMTERTTS